jgi:hypothetical protein
MSARIAEHRAKFKKPISGLVAVCRSQSDEVQALIFILLGFRERQGTKPATDHPRRKQRGWASERTSERAGDRQTHSNDLRIVVYQLLLAQTEFSGHLFPILIISLYVCAIMIYFGGLAFKVFFCSVKSTHEKRLSVAVDTIRTNVDLVSCTPRDISRGKRRGLIASCSATLRAAGAMSDQPLDDKRQAVVEWLSTRGFTAFSRMRSSIIRRIVDRPANFKEITKTMWALGINDRMLRGNSLTKKTTHKWKNPKSMGIGVSTCPTVMH